MIHPIEPGQIISSPGCHFTYRVIGACCRLFDRDQLPYPCCRIQWRGKEPSWRRIGRRFVLDMATRSHPTYIVEILEQGGNRQFLPQNLAGTLILTLYWIKLPRPLDEWWYADRNPRWESLSSKPPAAAALTTPIRTSGDADDKSTAG